MALNVKFLRGSSEKYQEYIAQSKIQSTTFYYIDEKDLYLGLIKLSNAEDLIKAISTIVGPYGEGQIPTTIFALEQAIKALGMSEDMTVKELIDASIAAERVAREEAEKGLITRITLLESSVEKQDAALDDHNKAIISLFKSVDENATETAILDERIDDAEKSLLTLKTVTEGHNVKITLLEADNEANKSAISTLQSLVKVHSDRFEGMEEKATVISLFNEAVVEVERVEKTVVENKSAITLLGNQIATHTDKITLLESRVATLEQNAGSTINGMDFQGVKDVLPETTEGYSDGDVIIVGKKEYIVSGGQFHEFGDNDAYALKEDVYTKAQTDAEIAGAMSWKSMD